MNDNDLAEFRIDIDAAIARHVMGWHEWRNWDKGNDYDGNHPMFYGDDVVMFFTSAEDEEGDTFSPCVYASDAVRALEAFRAAHPRSGCEITQADNERFICTHTLRYETPIGVPVTVTGSGTGVLPYACCASMLRTLAISARHATDDLRKLASVLP